MSFINLKSYLLNLSVTSPVLFFFLLLIKYLLLHCKVDIDGDVKYGLIPPRIIGFHGVVRISGGPGCPNGDLYFGIEPKDSVALTLPVSERKL